eukprot:8535598-Prorocentrum_lima.AAC.1
MDLVLCLADGGRQGVHIFEDTQVGRFPGRPGISSCLGIIYVFGLFELPVGFPEFSQLLHDPVPMSM